jgi:hypothetical protein
MGKAFNKTGRSNKQNRLVALPHYIMDTFAWRRLSVTARAAWLEFARIHNGCNNGKLAMSSRMLGERLGVSKDTADRAIKELLTFGFLQMTRAATFIIKRRAAEYLLTHIPDDRTEPKCPPSRAFQNIGKSGNGLDSHPLSQSHNSRQDIAPIGASEGRDRRMGAPWPQLQAHGCAYTAAKLKAHRRMGAPHIS